MIKFNIDYMGKISKFEDLEIWDSSITLAQKIYKITNNNNFYRDHSLKNQIRRSVISISSNIAEGFERTNNKEFIRFLIIAKASSGELRSQIYLAKTLQYLNEEEYNSIHKEILELSKKIGGFIKYLRKVILN